MCRDANPRAVVGPRSSVWGARLRLAQRHGGELQEVSSYSIYGDSRYAGSHSDAPEHSELQNTERQRFRLSVSPPRRGARAALAAARPFGFRLLRQSKNVITNMQQTPTANTRVCEKSSQRPTTRARAARASRPAVRRRASYTHYRTSSPALRNLEKKIMCVNSMAPSAHCSPIHRTDPHLLSCCGGGL